MKNLYRSIAPGHRGIFNRTALFFLSAMPFFTPSLFANADKTAKEGFVEKAKTLSIPFIANNGQADERVAFYARTFGGTVFVTKDGEIVYSLPEGRGKEMFGADGQGSGTGDGNIYGVGANVRLPLKGAPVRHGETPLVRAESAFVAVDFYAPLFGKNNADYLASRSRWLDLHCLVSRYRCQVPGLGRDCMAGQASAPDIIRTSGDACPTVTKINEAGASVTEAVSSGSLGSGKTVIQNPQSEISNSPSPMRGVALKEHLIGGRVNKIRGSGQSATNVSYFKGNDPSKWKSSLPTYEIVDMGEVYDGIGLRLKAHGNNVEKLFCIKPGADPGQIRIGLDGVKDAMARNEKGELVAETELGPVKFTKPVAYQEIDGKRVDVAVEYNIYSTGSGVEEYHDAGMVECGGKPTPQNSQPFNPSTSQRIYGFTVAFYDKTKNLIIDPLLASTFLGGYSFDGGWSLSVDTCGNVYVLGTTYSPDFPTTRGAYDTTQNDFSDLFISKLDGELKKLLASTFLGGKDEDFGLSLTLDTSGNVYVTGLTNSIKFPTTKGAYDTSFNGGDWWADAFVSKLNSGLSDMMASTFLGGRVYDQGVSIAIDSGGNVYVTGSTFSDDFPTTSGAYDTSFDGGNTDRFDAFVSKLDGDLTSLLASTYLGGAYSDFGLSIAFDASGNVYAAGNTRSADFPTTSGSYNTSYNGGYYGDVFISKLNSELTSLLISTFLGGGDTESGYSIALDTSGNVYVSGGTKSANFPTTSGAYNTSFNGIQDAFVSKLDGGLTNLLASTYLGGNDEDWCSSLAIDTNGNIFVAGGTNSSDYPTVSGGYDTSSNGYTDAFVSKFDSGLTSLQASTYLGGFDYEGVYSLTLDTSGNVYVVGYTVSSDFPATHGAYDTSGNGGSDGFVSKLDGDLSSKNGCTAKSITAAPYKFVLRKGSYGAVAVTVEGKGDCPVKGVTVTATIKGTGNRLIDVSPASLETDSNGAAKFTFNAKNTRGTAVVIFEASGLDKLVSVRVKVR